MNGGGSDERIGAVSGARKFGAVKTQVELQQEQDVHQGRNQQLESLEEQEQGE